MMKAGEMFRTFIAIELPPEIRMEMAEVQNWLRAEAAKRRYDIARAIRWVDPDAIHLTLKFLGDVAAHMVPQIEQELRQAVGEHSSFTLRLGKLGVFPHPKRPRVLWVGLEGDLPQLVALQAQVDNVLGKLGFSQEKRPFSPHLTLGRVRESVDPKTQESIGEVVEFAPVPIPATFVVESIAVMRSQLRPTGPLYSRMAEIPLLGCD
ncbi:MAG: RNA 2',3'-cyclic phosphodiesterase [Chloroflexi bacterium]|nr:RNA 2',3'-cyclic phosphodiesterase [Chloroflexota bacterium]MCL5076095.1 RNA 2',3'-cyclic phosphodiesterase [Chloroflexota bacterium]